MKIHHMIQTKRKELGMTQEQVANCLGVSTPAVNKWENGNSCPDIDLLCPLARLLKTDVNELLGFREELTRKEIADFVQMASEAAHEKGFGEGMKLASELISEYPNCSQLLYNLAVSMEGQAMLDGAELGEYKETIHQWYIRCSRCDDQNIRNLALHMLASKCINNQEFEEAQEYMNQIPDQEDTNKDMLKINILLGKGENEEAAELLERLLQKSSMTFQMYLWKLVDAELQCGNIKTAKEIAEIWRKISQALGVWEYSWYVADFQIAVETKNVDDSLKYLEAMLRGIQTPVGTKDSPIYYRVYKKQYGTKKEDTGKKLVPGLINDLKTNPLYEFLREDSRFHKLLEDAMR